MTDIERFLAEEGRSERVSEIQKEIDDDKNCGDGNEEDLAEAKKELDQSH